MASLLHTVLRQTPVVSESLVQFIKLWAKQGPALVKGNLYIGGKQLKNAVTVNSSAKANLSRIRIRRSCYGLELPKSKNVLLKAIAVKRSFDAEDTRIENSIYSVNNRTQKAIYDNSMYIVNKTMSTCADQTAGGKQFADADVPNPHDNRFNNLTGNRRGGGDSSNYSTCFNCKRRGCSVNKCKRRGRIRIKRNFEKWKKKLPNNNSNGIPERTAASQTIPAEGGRWFYYGYGLLQGL